MVAQIAKFNDEQSAALCKVKLVNIHFPQSQIRTNVASGFESVKAFRSGESFKSINEALHTVFCLKGLSAQRKHTDRTSFFSNLEHLCGGIPHQLIEQSFVHPAKLGMLFDDRRIGTMTKDQARAL